MPATALSVESSFFDALPAGSAVLDCVLVLRNVPFDWSVPVVEPRSAVVPVETALHN